MDDAEKQILIDLMVRLKALEMIVLTLTADALSNHRDPRGWVEMVMKDFEAEWLEGRSPDDFSMKIIDALQQALDAALAAALAAPRAG